MTRSVDTGPGGENDPNRALATIVAGPDGAMWFAEQYAIGRITPSGDTSTFRVTLRQYVYDVVAGPGDSLWFTTPTEVGRITTKGVITLWPIPGAQELGVLVYDPHHHGFLLADAKAAVLRWFPAPA